MTSETFKMKIIGSGQLLTHERHCSKYCTLWLRASFQDLSHSLSQVLGVLPAETCLGQDERPSLGASFM